MIRRLYDKLLSKTKPQEKQPEIQDAFNDLNGNALENLPTVDQLKAILDDETIEPKDLLIGDKHQKSKRVTDNHNAREIIAALDEDGREPTEEEIEQLKRYTGEGALSGSQDEFYTPKYLAKATWDLMGELPAGAQVLDPSAGVGIFGQNKPDSITLQSVEYNPMSAKINGYITGDDVIHSSFEEHSYKIEDNSLDGVITNVPFGKRDMGLDMSERFSDVARLEHYFILRSLELLKYGKRAVFIVPTGVIEEKKTNIKEKILQKASFVGGIRLPNKVFSHTGADVTVDILIFEKHREDAYKAIARKMVSPDSMDTIVYHTPHNSQFLTGKYFKDSGKKYTLGHFLSSKEFEESRLFTGGVRGNKTITTDDMETIKNKIALASKVKFSNKVDYNDIVLSDETMLIDSVNQENLVKSKEIELYFTEYARSLREKGTSTVSDLKEFKEKFNGLADDTSGILLRIMRTNNELVMALASINFISEISKVSTDMVKALILLKSVGVNRATFKSDKAFSRLNDTLKRIENMKNKANFRSGAEVADHADYNKYIDSVINNARLAITTLWDTEKNEKVQEQEYSRYDSYFDIKAKKGELSPEDVLTVEDVALSGNGSFTSMAHIAPHGARYNDVKAKISTMEFDERYGLSKEQFEQKKGAMLDSIEAKRTHVSISDVALTNANLKYMIDEEKYYKVQEIQKDVIEKMDFLYINPDNILKKLGEDKDLEFESSVSISTFGNKDAYRNLKKLYDMYPEEVLKATKMPNFEALQASLRNALYNTDKFGLTGVFRSERTLFQQLKPLIIKALEELKTEYDISVETHVKQDHELAQMISDHINQDATIDRRNTSKEAHTHLSYLKGYVEDEVLESNHGYQNEDIRHFGASMSGVIGQDTGLGKTRTIFMSALSAVVNNLAKRAIVVVPTAVFDKWKMEIAIGREDKDGNKIVKPMLTDRGLDLVSFIETDGGKKAWTAFTRDVNKRIAVMPHSTFSLFSFKQDTINDLIGTTKKEAEAEGGKVAVPSAIPEFSSKDWSTAFKKPKNSIGYFEDGDIEYLTIDEAQMAKNSATGGRGFKFAQPVIGSGYPVRVRVASAIISKAHGGANRGTVLATATPFTSSPYEIYTVLRTSGQLHNIRSFMEFQNMFIMTSKREVPMVTQPDMYNTVEVFDGISNITLLKANGLDSVVYRNAEGESQRSVNNIDKSALKPDETLHEVHADSTDDLENARQDLFDRYEMFKEYNKAEEDSDENLIGDIESRILEQYGLNMADEAHKLYVQSKGQTFSFIDNLNKLSIGADFAKNEMRFNVRGVNAEKLEKLVTSIRKKKVEYTVLKEIKVDGDFIKVKEKKKVPLSEYVDSVFKTNMLRGGELIIPVIDEAIAKQVTKELGDRENLLDIDDYPKYKALLANIREELNKDSSAKQIIFSASIAGTRIIEYFIKHLFKDLKLKTAKTMNAVDASDGGATQSDNELGALALLQESYNNSTEPTVLIYTERNTTGVDFNKRTAAVHLVDIPYTPDVWHQAKGRGVRQGNVIRDVQVYTYATAGTLDDAKMKILEVKAGWQEDLKTIDSKTLEYNGIDGKAIIEEATARFGGIPTPEQIEIIMEEKKSQALKIRGVEAKAKEKIYKREVEDVLGMIKAIDEDDHRLRSKIENFDSKEAKDRQFDLQNISQTTFLKNVKKLGAGLFNNKIMSEIDWRAYALGEKSISGLEEEIDQLKEKLIPKDGNIDSYRPFKGMLLPLFMDPESDRKWRRSQYGSVISPEEYNEKHDTDKDRYQDFAHTLTPTAYSGYKNLIESLFSQAKDTFIRNVKRLAGAKGALKPSVELLIEHTQDRATAEKLQGVVDGTHEFFNGRMDDIVSKDDIIQVYREHGRYQRFIEVDGEYWSQYGKKDISQLEKYDQVIKGDSLHTSLLSSIEKAKNNQKKSIWDR
ncbi:MAG: hypothetical protein ABXS91_08645 [Sulfurimonas sp.]